MSRLRLHPDDRITFNGVELRFVGSKTHTVEFRLAADPTLTVTHTHAELLQAQISGDWSHEPGYHAPVRAETREETGVDGLADLKPEERDRIDFKLVVCEHLDDLIAERARMRQGHRKFDPAQPYAPVSKVSLSDAGIEAALGIMWDRVQAEMAGRRVKRRYDDKSELARPGVQSVRDWYNALVEADWDASALCTRYANCGRREARHPSVVQRLLHVCAARFASEKRPSRRHLHRDLQVMIDDLNLALPAGADLYDVPSQAALNRRIDALEPFATYAARHGIKKARHKFRVLTGGVETLMPGERVEMDEHQIHLQADMTEAGYWHQLPEEDREVLAPCRLWVCAAVDCATKCELGLAWGLTPTADLALECLRQVMTDKSAIAAAVGSDSGWPMAARPMQIVTDNGSSFLAARFRTAVAAIHARHIRTVAGEPWMRGTRERAFRTHGQLLHAHFTGQTFADVVAKGDYPSLKRISLFGRMVVEAYVRNVLCVYHNRPHAGLGDETPADCWNRLTAEYGTSPLPGRDVVRAVFGTEVRRAVGPHGVRVFGLHYQSRELQAWHRSTLHADRIDVRIDHHDIGRVSVRIGNVWVNAECVTPHMDGMSIATYRETKAALAARFAAAAKIREPQLLEGIRAAQAMARRGLEIFGIDEEWSTPEAIERAESNLDMGWTMPGDEEDQGDPLSRAVPATGPEVAWPEPESPAAGPLFREPDYGGVDDPPQVHDADAHFEGNARPRSGPAAKPDEVAVKPRRRTWIED